ncbi:MAG: thioredoxin family protein [Melioribacteraceae bacterium]|nr:thioredoxin family protein [Melioribacteraceae bacterium]
MNTEDIISTEEFDNFIKTNEAAVVYFSTQECNVCKILKPKLIELLENKFPLFSFAYIDCNNAKELAAQNSVFSVPTIIFYMQGKELFRKSRNINLTELENELERPYSFIV